MKRFAKALSMFLRTPPAYLILALRNGALLAGRKAGSAFTRVSTWDVERLLKGGVPSWSIHSACTVLYAASRMVDLGLWLDAQGMDVMPEWGPQKREKR